jgi:hypothetical protein
MPGETLLDNCFKKRRPPFLAIGGKYTVSFRQACLQRMIFV